MTLFFIQHLGITRLREVAKILKISGYTLYDDPDELRQHIMKFLTKRYYVRQKHLDKIGKSQEQIDRLTRHLRELAKENRKRDSSPIRKAMTTTLTQLKDCGGECPSDVKEMLPLSVLSPQREIVSGMSALLPSLSRSQQKSPEIASATRKIYSLRGEEAQLQPLSQAPLSQDILPVLTSPEKKEVESQLYQEKVEAIKSLEKCEQKEVELRNVLEKLDQQLGTSTSLNNLSPLLDKVMLLQSEISVGLSKVKTQEAIISEMKGLLEQKPQNETKTVFEQKSSELITRVQDLDKKVAELTKEILVANQEIENKNKLINEQNSASQEDELRRQLTAKVQEILACNTSKEQCENKVQLLEEKIIDLESEMKKREEEKGQIVKQLQINEEKVNNLQLELNQINLLRQKELEEKNKRIREIESDINRLALTSDNRQIQEKIELLNQEKSLLEQKYREEAKKRDDRILQLEKELITKEETISRLGKENDASKKTIVEQKEAHQKGREQGELREKEMLQNLYAAINKNIKLEGLEENEDVKIKLSELEKIDRWNRFKPAMTELGGKVKELREQIRQVEVKGETPEAIQEIRKNLADANAKISELENQLRLQQIPPQPIIGAGVPLVPEIAFLDKEPKVKEPKVKEPETKGIFGGIFNIFGGNKQKEDENPIAFLDRSAQPFKANQPLPAIRVERGAAKGAGKLFGN